MSPKVSVIMPSLNVGRYIRKCIESVVRQSLKDIEIICVDAGSTDGTLEVLEEYAASDERIRIIHSDRKSYGYQMNLGLDAASGEFVGIVETDDWADRDMFKELYGTAHSEGLDVIKSDFWFYYSKPQKKNVLFKLPVVYSAMGVFCPCEMENSQDQSEFFNIKPSIWSAIYRRSFLNENGIRFNETPGASYQDVGFNFKVWACADKVRLVRDAYIHYRQDNEQSSVNSPAKAYCVCDEYAEINRFINDHFEGKPVRQRILRAVMCRLKYDSYLWNYMRLAEPLNEEFVRKTADEIRLDQQKGYADKEYFPVYKWDFYHMWADDTEGFICQLKRQQGSTFLEKVFRKIRRRFS